MHIGERFYTQDELQTLGFKSLGKNVLIKRNASIYFTENICIGDNSRIDDFTVLVASRELVSIGSYVHIASHCVIAGSEGFVMEDFSGLAPRVNVFTGSDDYSGQKLTNPTINREYTGGNHGKVVLGRHVIIGAGSTIFPGCVLSEGCSVGAMSLVNKNLNAWTIYAGIPAKSIKGRKKDLLVLEQKFLAENQINVIH